MPRCRPPTRKRGPNLTAERITGVVEIVRAWQGRLTWEALCDVVERRTGARYTRQALDRHAEVRAAYEAYREAPERNATPKTRDPSEEQVRALKLRVGELERTRTLLLERFARWSMNAAQAGLDETFLNRELPKIARAASP